MITVDARMLNSSGIGTYIRNVVPKVIEGLGRPVTILTSQAEWEKAGLSVHPNFRFKNFTSPIYSIREQLRMATLIPAYNQLFWSPHYNFPFFCRGRLVVTVHDVFHLDNPQWAGGFLGRSYAWNMFYWLRKRAQAILCNSQSTLENLQRQTGRFARPRQKLFVTPLGVTEADFQSSQESLHTKPYILFVGNIKPHKNLGRLLQAYAQIQGQIEEDLLIIGQKEGLITKDNSLPPASSFAGRVRFLGSVADLPAYYRHASLFVFPSLYEGFGLPPLEAMASSTPVICSHIPVLKEHFEGVAEFCDPLSVDSIAKSMLKVLKDNALASTLRASGLEKARKLTWKRTQALTLSALMEVIREHEPID